MARRGRSIGIVGDAYVPVPFKELMQSNLLKEQAYESAEEDILETETLLGATGATPGDEAFIRELEENFTTGFQTSLEETGNDLIGSSQFLQRQLGKITKAIGVTESNKKSRSDFHTAIDKANLDPHIAQYKKMEADAMFDQAGGSRAGVGFAPAQFVDFNGKEATELLMKFAKEVSKDTSIDYVYEHYNTAGQDIFEIRSILNSIEDPEEKQALLDRLGQGWDIPDPNINEGQPILNKQKTTAKHKNKIYNKIAPVAFDNPLLASYFQESTDASNFNSQLQDPESEPAEMADVFNDAIMNVANMMEVSLQEDSQSFMFEQETDSGSSDDSDSGGTPMSLIGSGLFTSSPAANILTAAAKGSSGSYNDMAAQIEGLNLPEYQKVYALNALDMAAGKTEGNPEVTEAQLVTEALNSIPMESSIQDYFKTPEGEWDMDKIQGSSAMETSWMNSIEGSYWDGPQKQVRDYKTQLQKELRKVPARLKEVKDDFTSNLDAAKIQAPQTERFMLNDTDANKLNLAAEQIFSSVVQGYQSGDVGAENSGIYKEGSGNPLSPSEVEDMPKFEQLTIMGFDSYPIVSDMTTGEAFRTVRFKGKEKVKGGTKSHVYDVKIPEAIFQSSIENEITGEYNKKYTPYKGAHSEQLNLIATTPGIPTTLPNIEPQIGSVLATVNENMNNIMNLDNLDVKTSIVKNAMTNQFEASIEVSVPYGDGNIATVVYDKNNKVPITGKTRKEIGEKLDQLGSRIPEDLIQIILDNQ